MFFRTLPFKDLYSTPQGFLHANMDLGETAFFQASRLAGLHIGLREDDILPDEDIETLSRPDPYRGLDVRGLLGQLRRCQTFSRVGAPCNAA